MKSLTLQATVAVLIIAHLPSAVIADEFAFIEDSTTHQHVSIQRVNDYYLVHFIIHATHHEHQKLFARVRTTYKLTADQDNISIASAQFIAQTDDDRWSIFLRAPRFTDDSIRQSVTYQIEVGTFDLAQVDEYSVVNAVAWKLKYHDSDNGADIVPKDPTVIARTATSDGTNITIHVGYAAPAVSGLKIDLVTALAANSIDGEATCRRLSQ
jgi:hypothetical protein